MAGFLITEIDQVNLEREGYHVHATLGPDHIVAIYHTLSHDWVWDHEPELSRVLTLCRKPIENIDNSGEAPC